MKVGYRSGMAGDGTLEVQRLALEAAGCVLVLEDLEVFAALPCRPGLAQLLRALRRDVLVVWRLDRLALEFADMLEVLSQVLLLGGQVLALADGLDSDRLSSDELIVIVMALMSHKGHVEAQQAMTRWRMRLEAQRWFGCYGDLAEEGAGSPPEPEPRSLRLPPPAGTPCNASGRMEEGKVAGVGLHPLFGGSHAYSLADPLRHDGPVRSDAHPERSARLPGVIEFQPPVAVLRGRPEGREGSGPANRRDQR